MGTKLRGLRDGTPEQSTKKISQVYKSQELLLLFFSIFSLLFGFGYTGSNSLT
jgi:hypothetical protein